MRGELRSGSEREGGFVLVWFALMITLLLGGAAFAVDFARAYLVATRAQSAADAAALGGAVFLPDDPEGATARALALVEDNGFDRSQATVTLGDRPGQLRVSVGRNMDTLFAKAIGVETLTVRRAAVAEYERPVEMGSPSNGFGNQPDCVDPCTSGDPWPDFWVNVAGPGSHKKKGDAHQAAICTGGTDNCTGGNADYDPNGYFYGIEVHPDGRSLVVDVFDPGFVNVGDECAHNDHGSHLLQASENPDVPDASRYAPGAESPYCTGDQLFDEGGGTPPWTSYRVLEPDGTPWTNLDNPPASCAPVDFPGRAVDLDRVLDPTTPEHAADVYGDSGPGWTASHFRRWVTVCTVVDPVPGTYLLQVTTATKADGSPAPAGGGHNRFALRTHLEGDLAGGGTSMFGDGRMAIYANAPTANTTFFLARVHPGASGRTLNLLFYDTGDAPGDSTGTLTVLPPVEATVDPAGGGAVPLTTFAGCTYTAPPGNSAGPPFGADTATGVGCSVSGVSSSRYNGQWVHWRVPIPDGYQCDLGSPFGCWLRINFSFTGRVTDTTTWTAYLDGNPVRLVE